ncbi:hypothetical protein DICPUDRAFT_96248 [Dictyostelium purpureum]|uniref:RBR-type E3 ubiquitin transferase n=1 Tax=Dictyostelium purpureum TaxID=5786 RepID=F0Z6I9_DICPU|nr:uncharacterized protein DICPUDRAFT_96248 [Dictyostelium purpureum]EGC40498.1 hypothetical protein DICPUDRAFT_96248 [Dictyostelium purpureum]|eukprot:XP_003283045.1 hypothetical protein DICPUDRAFT_96248 [Dictyostelium purpureum]
MSHRNTSEELYINIEVPDSRKRFTITYEKNENDNESLVILVPNNLTFSGLLGQIINRFKLEASDKSKIRVKTNGHRVKNLLNSYNNQVFNFTISNIVDQDPEDEETSERALTKSEENNFFQEELRERQKKAASEFLQLFKSGTSNRNIFYNKIIVPLLKSKGDNRIVIVGESYPYRCKVIILNSNKDTRVVLYFIEQPSNGSLNYKTQVFIEENKPKSKLTINQIEEVINEQYKTNRTNVVEIVTKVEQLYNDNVPNIIYYDMSPEALDLFSEIKSAKTESQNVAVSTIYNKTESISSFYDIPYSFSKNLLWQNKFETKKIKGNGDEKNISIIRSLSFPHKAKDISLYRFKNVVEVLPKGSQIECPICFCEYDNKETIELICGHRYCNGCLSQYFLTSANDGNGNRIQITCPHLGCLNKCIDEVTIETCLPSKKDTSNMLKGMIKDYTFNVAGTFPCPEANCGRLILNLKSVTGMLPYVNCDTHHFCLLCKKSGYHWPLLCTNTSSDSKELFSYKWILENTTICSSCQYPIEKNSGCDHMTCSRCKYQFCYRCGSKYQYPHDCNNSQHAKIKFFFNTFSSKAFDIDLSFMEEFFKRGDFQTHDPLVNHLYRSFVSIITEKKFKCKRHLQLLENAIFSLYTYSNRPQNMEKFNSLHAKSALKRLLRENNLGSSYLARNKGPKIRSLSANICINGSKKVLANIFVNTQFHDFKQEIATQLNKLPSATGSEPFDPKKLRVYNIYGGQIKNSLEVLDSEPLFISKSINEPFVIPEFPTLTPEEIEEAKKKIDEEKEKEVVIQIGKKFKKFTELRSKEKRSQDKSKLFEKETTQLKIQEQLINDRQVKVDEATDGKPIDQYSYYYKNNDGIYSDEDSSSGDDDNGDEGEEDVNELLLNEFINIDSGSSSSEFEDDNESAFVKEAKQAQQQQETIDKEQRQIEIVIKVLEFFQDDHNNGLDFEKVFDVCFDAKNLSHAIKLVTKYLDETVYSKQYGLSQEHILIKQVLIDLYPHVSHNVIDTAIKESGCNLEKAKHWILHKFIKQQKRKQKQPQQPPKTTTLVTSAITTNVNNNNNNLYQDIIEDEYHDEDGYDDEEDKINSKLYPKYKWY